MLGNNDKIVWLDIDTTGVDPETDRIIKVDLVKADKSSGEVVGRYLTMVNPEGVHSSLEALDRHHISDESLVNQPLFKDIAQDVFAFFEGCDIGCHNLRFDLNFLMAEFNRCGINFTIEGRRIVETSQIYSEYGDKGLLRMYKEYHRGRKPRKAMTEADVVMELYRSMAAKHNLTEADVDRVCGNGSRIDLDGMFVRDERNRVVMGRGKHKGEPIENVDPDYFDWMCTKSQRLTLETKGLARRVYNYLKKRR